MRFGKDSPFFSELGRFVKFGLTGVMNTAVDFLVFTVLSYLGLGIYLSQVLSYSAGMLNSYVINRSWTFHAKGRFFGAQMRRFLIVNLSLLALSLAILRVMTGGLGLPRFAAKICATVCTMVLGFLLNRLWVFRTKEA